MIFIYIALGWYAIGLVSTAIMSYLDYLKNEEFTVENLFHMFALALLGLLATLAGICIVFERIYSEHKGKVLIEKKSKPVILLPKARQEMVTYSFETKTPRAYSWD